MSAPEPSEASRPSAARRLSAVAAIGGLVVAVVIVAFGVASNVGIVLLACAGVALVVVGAWYLLARRAATRILAAVLIVVGLAMVCAALLAGDPRWIAIAGAVVAAAVSVAAAGYALGRRAPEPSLAGSPSAPRPSRPVLLINPKSGGGKAERHDLVGACRARGIEAIVLGPDDDLLRLARDAVARGADVIGMAGGDGSQALVGSVASEHGIAHVVVPAGTRNHFALDLGLDRDDVVGALDAYADGVERTIDLAEVNERVFVNNVSLGLYAKIVQSPEYRDAKVQTTLSMLPDLVGPDAEPLDLRFDGPDGAEIPTAAVIQVSNDPYEVRRAEGRGSRPSLSLGVLGIVALRLESAADAQRVVSLQALGRLDRFEGWHEWTAPRFEVRSSEPVEVGVDGEAFTLEPPLVFASRPGALRVRLPRHAPGRSPAAAAVHVTSPMTVRELLRIAVGRGADPR